MRVEPDVLDAIAHRAARTVVEEFVIPVRSGRAWELPAGPRLPLLDHRRPAGARPEPVEPPRPARALLGRPDATVLRRARQRRRPALVSTLPFLRPLATVVADSIEYGIDEDGAGCHDLLGTRCDGYVGRMLAGERYDFHCHSNLVRAVLPWGLTEFDVHDVINVFQVTGLMPGDERYFMKTCPATVGDHFELFAEIDLLMAASTCPGGDLSVPLWGPGSGTEPNCNAIKVEVFAARRGRAVALVSARQRARRFAGRASPRPAPAGAPPAARLEVVRAVSRPRTAVRRRSPAGRTPARRIACQTLTWLAVRTGFPSAGLERRDRAHGVQGGVGDERRLRVRVIPGLHQRLERRRRPARPRRRRS